MLSTASGAFGWRIISAWRSVFCLTLFQDCPHLTLVRHIHALIPRCVSCLELPLCRATNSQPEQTLAVSSLWKPDVRSGLGCWLPIPDPLWGCVPGENILISIVQFITFLACRILRRLMWRLKWYSQETSRTRRCRKHAPKQWFSAFLRLQPFTTVSWIVVTPTRKLFRHFS